MENHSNFGRLQWRFENQRFTNSIKYSVFQQQFYGVREELWLWSLQTKHTSQNMSDDSTQLIIILLAKQYTVILYQPDINMLMSWSKLLRMSPLYDSRSTVYISHSVLVSLIKIYAYTTISNGCVCPNKGSHIYGNFDRKETWLISLNNICIRHYTNLRYIVESEDISHKHSLICGSASCWDTQHCFLLIQDSRSFLYNLWFSIYYCSPKQQLIGKVIPCKSCR